jgi:ferrochelatase
MSGPAVILMAYGSPDRLADVPEYYADIRGGRPIRPELLDDLVARYRALGIDDSDGPSPLNAITEKTRAALERTLDVPVSTGMRHWQPRIAAAVEEALERGHETLVGLVLAPHWSSLSIAKYLELFEQAVAGRAETRFVREWGAEPGLVGLLAERIGAAARPGAHVVFTAHSLPTRIVEVGDTYPESLLQTARLVADRATIHNRSLT